jgi:hypothetical protein
MIRLEGHCKRQETDLNTDAGGPKWKTGKDVEAKHMAQDFEKDTARIRANSDLPQSSIIG